MNSQPSENIPGATDTLKLKLLFKKTKNLILKDNDILVEIGTLFGKNTHAITKGLLSNSRYKKFRSRLYAYDSFERNINNSFTQNILDLANEGNVLEKLRKRTNQYLNYEQVFSYYLHTYIEI